VVLSAAKAAWGRSRAGEGCLGFSQALFLAGTRSLVLSLWKADDTATPLLMQRFYQNLLGKRADLKGPLAKAEALAINSIGELAERLLRTFQANDFSRPTGRIIAVEEELRGPLIPGLPDLLARVDLLVETEEALEITDFKTSGSAWGGEQVTDAASQLLLLQGVGEAPFGRQAATASVRCAHQGESAGTDGVSRASR
jgi:hypothetical protein